MHPPLLPITVRSLMPLAMAAAVAACSGNVARTRPDPVPAAVAPSPVVAIAASPGKEVVVAIPAREAMHPSETEPVLFDRGSSVVDDRAMAVLRRHAERLTADPALVVTLVGRTDDLGSRSYNVAVAERRVAAVVAALRGLGVPRGQIRRASAGGEVQRVPCASDECRVSRRRVDFFFSSHESRRGAGKTGRVPLPSN